MVDDMASEESDKKKDQFDAFTPEGEAIGYISLDQARVLAIQHARDNTDFYGPRYADQQLAWEVLTAEESEDYYDVRLSYRPAGRFRGEPGIEQITIEKTGTVELRQLLRQPARKRSPVRLLTVVGLVVVAVGAAVSPARSRAATCPAPPGTCDARTRSPSADWPCRAARAADRAHRST